MEESAKREISVEVAGITMSLITDESEEFVNSVIKRVSGDMSALMNKGAKRSALEAAVMCAIDYCADKMTAEKKVRNLEAQVSLYEASTKRLKEEIAELKSTASVKKSETSDSVSLSVTDEDESKSVEEEDECQIRIDDGMPTPDPKEKIRQIEELLRRGKA